MNIKEQKLTLIEHQNDNQPLEQSSIYRAQVLKACLQELNQTNASTVLEDEDSFVLGYN